jgi:Leucine-rich repeat (LRR) protein
MDSLTVFAIFKINNIPVNKFSSIVTVGDDWRVQSIDLSGYGIDTLPDEISNLGALEKLNISNNNLHSLPNSIIKLRIFYPYEYYGGGCSTYSDCHFIDMLNGLTISGNSLCNVPSAISEWVDTQFKRKNYLHSDTTQRCW